MSLNLNAQPIRVGVSACLLGHEVRFDGGHKRDGFLTEILSRFVEFVPVCPEVELGLGVPRETLRLERRSSEIRMIANRSGVDHTEAMLSYAARRVDGLAGEELSGYILKKDSPSCGMLRVRVYGDGGVPSRDGRGLFAEALIRRWPYLPVEEEGRLNDAVIRENFVERIFAYRRLQDFFASRWTRGGLVKFHSAHKLMLLAHAPASYRALGQIVAGMAAVQRPVLRANYAAGFMNALCKPATAARNTNVLQHIAGYFRKLLDGDSRRELAELIDDYRRGLIPLVVPITLLRHYARRFDIAYLKQQIYLDPHPRELMLRNHV
ncbi:MAG TPA: DUF523 and DUF1722 domain-containing protein [Candidatus Binataceae bacterium]|nr:DUF523 and DUF1722 domain-containing protein [Candidatus Binataceae bacterium]